MHHVHHTYLHIHQKTLVTALTATVPAVNRTRSHLNTARGGWLALTLTRLKVRPYVSVLTGSKGWDSSLRRSF